MRQIIERVNGGVGLDEVLDFVYEECRDTIPYNRIGFAVIDEASGRIVARWARSDGLPKFPVGYWCATGSSSLMDVARAGRPRIINDLSAYAASHPASEVTRLLVEEGLRSSLTCPLRIEGRPVRFLFFDHQGVAMYSSVHVEFFEQIAGVVSVAAERGRMFSELAEKSETIAQQNRALAEENRRNQQELEMARTVQAALIPESLPTCAGLRMAMLYEPAELVGGDLLDAIALGEGRMLVYMADAMGHGVPAALLMSVVRTAFHGAAPRTASGTSISPGAVLAEVNCTIIDLFGANYVTAVCGRIDVRARRLTLASAGHPPALVRRGGSAGGRADSDGDRRSGGVP